MITNSTKYIKNKIHSFTCSTIQEGKPLRATIGFFFWFKVSTALDQTMRLRSTGQALKIETGELKFQEKET